MSARGALALWILGGCASAPPRAPPPVRVAAPITSHGLDGGTAVSGHAEESSEPPWVAVAPRGLPATIEALRALGPDRAVLLAGGRLWRWEGGTSRAICPEASPRVLDADGDRFVALDRSGSSDAEFVRVWYSADAGERCGSAEVPLRGSAARGGGLGVRVLGESAVAWDGAGSLARSDDGGAHWRSLPALVGVALAYPGPGPAAGALLPVGAGGERLRRYTLGTGAWTAVDERELRAPVAVARAPGGGLTIADGAGTLALATDGATERRTLEPAFHDPLAQPRVLAPAGVGSFVGVSRHALFALDAGGLRPLAEVPADATALSAFDARSVWLTARGTLYRLDGDGPMREVAERPLGHSEAVAAAAADNTLAMLAADGAVAVSADRGEHWSRAAVPDEVKPVFGLAAAPNGETLVLGAGGLAIADDGRFVTVPLPSHAPSPTGSTPRVAVLGERWLIVDGGVFTSDDQGQRWTSRPLGASGRARGAMAIAVAIRGAGALVLDAARQLWRSDDAGATFSPVGALDSPRPGEPRDPGALLAWDGGARVAVFGRRLWLSADGGASWVATVPPGLVRAAEFLPDGRLLVLATGGAFGCGGAPGDLLQIQSAPDSLRFAPVPDACDHRGLTFSLDGPRVWLLTPGGTLYRGDAARIAGTAAAGG